ncbi:hypothetical protein Glove_246g22 [Diversispora epigaea]|uniref:Uncharacterized protein n=1 Tax=Diversispora epigaea TaxID=1348612 RepID=A0A397IEA7_9GLOM|nr:hypothetical protein Glove_246g22 [Diversispora epigaea]
MLECADAVDAMCIFHGNLILLFYTKNIRSLSVILHLVEKLTVRASIYSSYPKADADAKCDQVIEITLSELEHYIHGPFTSDLSTSLSKFLDFIKKKGWEDEINQC